MTQPLLFSLFSPHVDDADPNLLCIWLYRVEAARVELELHKRRLEILDSLSAPHARLLDLNHQLPHLVNRVAVEEEKVRELDAKIATLAGERALE